MFILISLKINVKRLSKKEEEPEDFLYIKTVVRHVPPLCLCVYVCVCVCMCVRACMRACVVALLDLKNQKTV